jgi:hypothetical protein
MEIDKTYEIIFAVLSIAFGVLVLQGVVFISFNEVPNSISRKRIAAKMAHQEKQENMAQ